MIGKTIGKYRFVDELGRDGLGVVYKAHDETLDREVAIKVLTSDTADQEVMQRFQAEAATLARLNHPDIAGIHEFQKSDHELLMVMEFVRGETLEQLADRCGPLPPERAAYLVAQVLAALHHAHSAGVVHRDLKPSNVIVTEPGGVKVMDFGLARVAGAEQMTADGFMLGSPAYMAPERLAGQEVDGRADVYSAGVIFYRLLTGRVPFAAPTPLEMVQKQLTDAPTPLTTHRPDAPGWCQAILDRALARSPADRFPSADAFCAALLAVIGEATASTGVYAAPAAVVPAAGDAVTAYVPLSASAAAIPPAGALTVASWAPLSPLALPETSDPSLAATMAAPAAAAAALSTPVPRVSSTTVVLKKNQFALAGALLVALVVGVGVLAVAALRRPSHIIVTAPAPAPTVVTPSPAVPAPAATPAPAPAAVTAPPVEIIAPPLILPPASAPRPGPVAKAVEPFPPSAPPRPGVDTTPFRFAARAVVLDGDKRRERDTTVLLADGSITVTEKNAKALYLFPLDGVIGLTFSSSRQPLWESPEGPAEAMRVEGGAFGFLKGGRNNWFGIQTRDSLLVLRVDDGDVRAVITGLQTRTGLVVRRLVERKD